MAKIKIIEDNEQEEQEKEQEKEEQKEEISFDEEQQKWVEELKRKLQGKKGTIIIYRKESSTSPWVVIGREEFTEADTVHDIIDRYGFERGGIIKAEIRVGGKYIISPIQKEYEKPKKEEQQQPQTNVSQPIQQDNIEKLIAMLQGIIDQERERHLQDMERLRKEQEMVLERMKAEQQQKEQMLSTIFQTITQQTQAFIQMQQAMQQTMQQKSDEFMKTIIEILKVQQYQPQPDITEQIMKLKSLGIIPEKQDNTEMISKMFELINNSFNLGLNIGMQRLPEEKTDVEKIIEGITDALKNIIELKKIAEKEKPQIPSLPSTPQPQPQIQPQQKIAEGGNMKKEFNHPFEKILNDYRGTIIMFVNGPASAKEIADAIFNQIPEIYFDAFCDYVKNKLSLEKVLEILPELQANKEKVSQIIEQLKLNVELFENPEKMLKEEGEGGTPQS
jgi:hypothetical protein